MKLSIALASALALFSVAGCKKKAADPAANTGEAMAKMTEFKDKMCACKDADCAKKVSDEMTAWSQKQGTADKPVKMTEADQKKTTELGTQMGECMSKAMAMGGTGAGSATPPAGSGSEAGSAAAAEGSANDAGSAAAAGLPKECDDYKASIDRLATCDKIAVGARETLIKAYKEASADWAALPEAAKANLKGSCKAGAQSVLAVAKQHCGW